MRENNEDQQTNLSNYQNRFLDMIMTDPVSVFKAVSSDDVLKPFIYKESTLFGGKLGIRTLARKYKITERRVRTLINQIKKNSEKWSE
jgi:hypothetical protein